MVQVVEEAMAEIMAKDSWTGEDHKAVMRLLLEDPNGLGKFRSAEAELERQNPEPRGVAALKIGIARYVLCRFPDALAALADGTDNRDRRYFQGLCWKQLRRYDKAAEELERARSDGWDPVEIETELIEVQALGGDVEGAAKALAKAKGKLGNSADYHYLRGLIEDFGGNYEGAAEAYDQARGINPDHVAATFRLAYCQDLHGDEEAAIELYQQCVSRPPVHASVLMNLAVLHEDAGRYNEAVACLKRVLATNPNHPRARLFLKDVEASRTMYFDEDQARRIARRNAVLDIPVTDFELSVRARNCLKKMNIRTLGDLLHVTEPELLSYKNFGETSLAEIKQMLTSKGLRLGQMRDEGELELTFDTPAPPSPATVGNEGVLATPLAQIEFSVRARRALERLGLRTLGELACKTDAELLGCRNFGQTSLNEVSQRLSEYGLSLRQSD